jgi:spore germination cell wall hydrolase CwlJ-like protein
MLKELFLGTMLTFHGHTVDVTDLTQGQLDELYQRDSYCLAQNIYHEARNQPTAGQLAVASVTINRVNDPRFPNTICDVVMEGPHRPSWKGTGEMIPVRNRCQFSWYCDGKSDVPKNEELFQDILVLTEGVVSGSIKVMDITEGATHYHADYVMPAWAETKTKTIEIEDHIFYRWEK